MKIGAAVITFLLIAYGFEVRICTAHALPAGQGRLGKGEPPSERPQLYRTRHVQVRRLSRLGAVEVDMRPSGEFYKTVKDHAKRAEASSFARVDQRMRPLSDASSQLLARPGREGCSVLFATASSTAEKPLAVGNVCV